MTNAPTDASRHRSLFIAVGLLSSLGLAGCSGASSPAALAQKSEEPVTFNAELAYLKAVNEAGPLEDPQVVALLMAEFQSSNRRAEGISFFQSMLERYQNELTPPQKLVYLSSIGLLRAQVAQDVSLLGRIQWVNDTIDILEQARQIGNNQAFYSRFATGIVYARLPAWFGKRDQALTDLEWLVDNQEKALQPGQMREVYRQLAGLYQSDGRTDEAARYLESSGYDDIGTPLVLITNQSVDAVSGSTFHPRRFKEIVPGKIFLLSGIEFTEHYFVVSEDGKRLIAIDTGTRPDAVEAALTLLREQVPNLPPLTTVFITHAHWDHIGGHRFYREMNPDVQFYGRANYQAELDNMAIVPGRPFDWFFGTNFSIDLIEDYRPDVLIDEATEVTIGGTRFSLIPAPGGETPDGMFIHIPDHDVLFVGDFIMPFVGAPFIEEGDPAGVLAAIDMVVELSPVHLLHGHEALTRNFTPAELLKALRSHLAWLIDEVQAQIQAGTSRADIHHLNLIPPALFDDPGSQLVYLVMRENLINRVYDQTVGYWESNLDGLDHLSAEEYGALLTGYFDLSEPRLASALAAMIEAGDYQLAERVVRWGLTQYPRSDRLAQLQRTAALRLKVKYQSINPFKFILYSELANDPTPQLPAIVGR